MNRKGDWIQIFLVMFFFLLLVVGMSLLFVQKDLLEPERPELTQDLLQHRANSVLISLLRLPIDVDINGDNIKEQTTVAAVLTLDDREYDDTITAVIEEALENGSYSITAGGYQHGDIKRGMFVYTTLPGGLTVELIYAENNLEEYFEERDNELYREVRRA